MNVLLAQLDPGPDPVGNAQRVVELVAADSDRDLIAFPELFLGGYATTDLGVRSLHPGDQPMTEIAAACRRQGTAVVVGFTEALDREGTTFANSAACFAADGSTAAIYRKAHLFGAAETSAFEPGDALRLVELAGTKIGPMICFDVEFPEPARRLGEAGAEILLTIAANMEPYEEDHLLATRARALDNRRHHLYVNRVGTESGHRFVGHSRVVAPGGGVLAELGADEGLLTIELDPRQGAGADVDYLSLIRPDLSVADDNQPGGER